MFCPEGYVPWSHVLQTIYDWSEIVHAARNLEFEGNDPAEAFGQPWYWSGLSADGLTKDDWKAKLKENELSLALLVAGTLSKILLENDTLICSKDGVLLKAPSPVLLHSDRLDWCYWTSWPARQVAEFQTFFKYFDEGKFNPEDVLSRFCCLDPASGLITEKNNTAASLSKAMHMSQPYDSTQKQIEGLVRPFCGWAVTWNPSHLPSSWLQVFVDIGAADPAWPINDEKVKEVSVGRPRKLEKALMAYHDIYPDGHEATGDSWKMAASKISSKLHLPVHEDTVKRALGKKR